MIRKECERDDIFEVIPFIAINDETALLRRL